MSLFSNLSVLYSLAVAPVRGGTHAQRLESFYRRQACHYDAFRDGLLHGRRDLFSAIDVPQGAVWADFGGGTGASLDFMGSKVERVKKGYIVDLSPSLLARADERIQAGGLSRIETVEAEAGVFVPREEYLDLATFSYSLTMIPDWFGAVEHAWELLRPGGVIGVVDFYVSRKYPGKGCNRHGWLTRSFWPLWFAFDNVHLSADHVPYLHWRFAGLACREDAGKVPFLPGMRVPYYVFIGMKADKRVPFETGPE